MNPGVPWWQQSCILDRNKKLKIGRGPYNITYPKICQAVCEKTNFKISASQNAFAALAAMLNFLSARNILKIIRLLSLLHYLVKLCGTEFQRRSCLYGFPIGSYVKLCSTVVASWNLDRHKKLKFCRGPSKVHLCNISNQSAKRFVKRRFLKFQPIRTH